MIPKIVAEAQNPNCLMCIMPDGGFFWASGIHDDGSGAQPIMPRVVAESEAERIGLITSTNIYKAGTHWEALNPASPARINTSLDLRGNISSYTVIVDFEAANFGGLSNQKQELAGQGPSISSANWNPICSLAYYSAPGIQMAQEIGGARIPLSKPLATLLTGRHTAVGVVSVNTSTSQTTLSIYLDGDIVGVPSTYSGIPTGISSWTNYAINENRNGALTNHFGKVYSALLFGVALTPDQIKYLS